MLALASLVTAGPATADGAGYYVKPYIGPSFVDDTDFGQRGIAAAGADGSGSFDTGWLAGLGFGYRYGNGWVAEVAWEYRSNDNDRVRFDDGTTFDGGDFASNTLYLNGYYQFDVGNPGLRPYVGAGIGWVEEIDLDLEAAGVETSYSSDGDLAWQVMAGLEYDLNERWSMQGELRYNRVSGVDLDEEAGNGRIEDADVDAWLLGLGVTYAF
jgi:opacity protein-like surface antigen